MELQHKSIAVSGVKVLDAEKGIVEAFVAGIGNRDSVKDIIQPGAFDASLDARKPKCVWSHNWDLPIGKCLEAREVKAGSDELPQKMKDAGCGGLYTKTQFNLNTQRGKDAFEDVLFFGDEQEWSIGYKEENAKWDEKADANLVYKVGLYEYSPVLFGANSATATTAAKDALSAVAEAAKGGDTDAAGFLSKHGMTLDDVADLIEADTDEAEKAADVTPEIEADDTIIEIEVVDEAAPKSAARQWMDVKRAEAVTKVADTENAEDRVKMFCEAVPGSIEAFQCAVRDAIGDTAEAALASYYWVAVTFTDRVVVAYERAILELVDAGGGYYVERAVDWECDHVQYDVTVDATGEVVLSNPTNVDIVATIVPEADDGDEITSLTDRNSATFTVNIELSDDAKSMIDRIEKAGRVLSQTNYDRVVAAKESLEAVITAATPVDDTTKDDDVVPETKADDEECTAFAGDGDECTECTECGKSADEHATDEEKVLDDVTLSEDEIAEFEAIAGTLAE